MIQHPFNGNNNGGAEFIPRQSGSNSQFDNSYKRNNSITQMSTSMTSAGQQSNRSLLNWQENANNKGGRNGSRNWNEDHKRTPQRGICWKFFRGEECPYGEIVATLMMLKLNAGTVMDPRQIRESSVIDIKTVFDHGQSQTKATTVQVSSHPDVLQTSVKNNYWKTRICSKWETTGHCVFGDKCNYAHGLAELNTPVGLIEGDGSVAANGVHIPITEPLVTHSAGAAPVHIGSQLLNLAKRKVKGIYGDWIDDEYEE
ncbi:zinc finger, CCCH-type [Artemisia annua]|uniref:Zinc finger, CCCH-type n=1 Tax=Artemisia annua TaxID=35608 RepID=A0A2U1KUD7_ARTAN|nr:zinc finger, CCCH-type [Artemisia annua]